MNVTKENKFTSLTRWIGGGAMVLSAIQFLTNGKYDLNTLDTYYLFLGLNVITFFLGIIMAKQMKAFKTARAFLGITLTMLPAAFAQFGGFVHSKFGAQSGNLPTFFKLAFPEGAAFVEVAIISLVFLVPITMISLKVFNRREATKIGLAFLGCNLLLLVPIRIDWIIGCMILGQMIVNMHILKWREKYNTFEEKASRLLLFVPILIMAGRNLLHPYSQGYIGLLLALVGLFPYLSESVSGVKQRPRMQLVGCIMLFLSTLCFQSHYGIAWPIWHFVLVFLLFLLSYNSVSGGYYHRGLASFLAATGVLFYCFNNDINWGRLFVLLIPLSLAYIGVREKEKYPFSIGLATTVIFFVYHVAATISFPHFETWKGSALFGIVMVIASGIMERYKESIKSKLSSAKEIYFEWK